MTDQSVLLAHIQDIWKQLKARPDFLKTGSKPSRELRLLEHQMRVETDAYRAADQTQKTSLAFRASAYVQRLAKR